VGWHPSETERQRKSRVFRMHDRIRRIHETMGGVPQDKPLLPTSHALKREGAHSTMAYRDSPFVYILSYLLYTVCVTVCVCDRSATISPFTCF
jgi:hypothetical protein